MPRSSKPYFWFQLLAITAMLLFTIFSSVRAETTSASGAIAITSIPATGYIISSPGTYYLAADVSINANIPCAINITASNVTLDFNGHTLTQSYTSDNGTIGVNIDLVNNITVRNGTITGFLEGFNVYASNFRIEDMSVIATTFYGMVVNGSNYIVRHCRVNNTGGETVPGLAPYAVGLAIGGSNGSVIDCDITTLTPGPNCYTVCILFNSISNALVVNNRLSGGVKGTETEYSTGKCRDNLCASNIPIPYDNFYTVVLDAGNNQ